ncbi:MAG: NAD(P)-dependent glycerol-3-phosphate dehydrogenase [Phycisphaeraceae bacterium]|nr:MAG: NAD(P)-dependent glycerol-3-phosphate dehydrogenase [Phycisphaeraceae bacterium]
MIRHVTILGCGQMGLVCGGILTDAGRGAVAPTVTMWGHPPEEAAELSQLRRSGKLPDFELDPAVRVALDDASALREADLIVSAIPVQHTRSAWERLRPFVPERAGVVSVAKGIENKTMMRPTQIIADVLGDDPDGPPRPMGCLSGPTIATELARCLPATMIAASDDPAFSEALQKLFTTSWMRIYTNPDLLGVELAGATKNVIALAAGVLDGLQAGSNAKSALLARGLAEITRLGVTMGASPDTFFGIAGVGDLATTCFSPHGRNRSCGEALGKGERLGDYLDRSPMVVEGVATTRSVVSLAEKYRVDMPITHAVHQVLFEGLDPLEAIGRLMSRGMKDESVG